MKISLHKKTWLVIPVIMLMISVQACNNENSPTGTSCEDIYNCMLGTWNVTSNYLEGTGTVTFNNNDTGTTDAEEFMAYLNGVYLTQFEWTTSEQDEELILFYSDNSGGFWVNYMVTIEASAVLLELSYDDESVITLTR